MIAACQLTLVLFILTLCWRSIKCLSRSSTEMDLKILQLWSLVAFHKIYTYTGIEWILSFVPFYYYVKFILIVITILPLNFAPFWFESVLVPVMRTTHWILDIEWKYIRREIILLPWRIIDLAMFPGLLSDEACNEVNNTLIAPMYKSSELRNEVVKNSKQPVHINSVTEILRKENTTTASIHYGDTLNDQTSTPPKSIIGKRSSYKSPVANSRMAVSSLHMREFSRKYRNSFSESAFVHDCTSSGMSTPRRRFQRNQVKSNVVSKKSNGYNLNLSERVRTLITGDSKIRLRDFLFDLDLPELPSGRHTQKNETNSADRVNMSIRSRNHKRYEQYKNQRNRRHTIETTIRCNDVLENMNVLKQKKRSRVVNNLNIMKFPKKTSQKLDEPTYLHKNKDTEHVDLEDDKIISNQKQSHIRLTPSSATSHIKQTTMSHVELTKSAKKRVILRRSKRLSLKTDTRKVRSVIN